jgi:hypothetical protein
LGTVKLQTNLALLNSAIQLKNRIGYGPRIVLNRGMLESAGEHAAEFPIGSAKSDRQPGSYGESAFWEMRLEYQ